jgi:DTW domain-containing protein
VSPVSPEPNAEEPRDRATCYRCFRPAALCLCSVIPRVDNRVPVVILQHPRERTHPFNTARLAELGLERVEVLVDHAGALRRDASRLGALEGCALLYPGPSARDVTTLAPSEVPARLFVIDGTWHHARTLYRDIPVLQSLPHLTLPAHLRSAFQIRRQPNIRCLSTIEALVFALRAFEPETQGLDALLASFDVMQGRQLAIMGNSGRTRRTTRSRESRAIPRKLIEGYASLVVAYAESAIDAEDAERRVLLCCVAERLATGERFRGVIRHPSLSDAHLEHLGLSRSELDAGLSPGEFQDQWARFLRHGENLAAWNLDTLDMLCGAAGVPRSGVALKAAYHNLKRFRGSLEDIVRLEGLDADTPSVGGRANARSANAAALAKFLHRQGGGSEAGQGVGSPVSAAGAINAASSSSRRPGASRQ